MKKRILALILALIMVVPMIACGADDAKQPAVTTPKAGDTTARKGAYEAGI